jgi:hypothetical protein
MKLRFVLAAMIWLVVSAVLAASERTPVSAIDPVVGEKLGRELVQQILELRPTENLTNTGLLKILKSKNNPVEIDIPVQFKVSVTRSNWQAVYRTQITATNGDINFGRTYFSWLTIIRSDGQPDVYQVPNVNPPREDTNQFFNLTPEQTMTPFALSDFWLADLGLEFLHWPQQKVLKKEMRRSCSCSVLESVNPHPTTNGYSRVVTWIDNESLGIVQAEAYDSKNKLLKEFYPKDIKKVNGQWQVQTMDISNVQTRSRTRIEFHLDSH